MASLLVVALSTVGVFAFGWAFFEVLLDRINGTVMLDNPAYPGDAFCQGPSDPFVGDCDAPREVERNIDVIITDVRGQFLGLLFIAPSLGWLFRGFFLHVGSWLAGNEGTVKDSFAIAAWGLAPGVFSILVLTAVLWVTFDPITVTPESNPEGFLDIAMAELEAFVTTATVLGLVSSVWGAYIHFGGLVATRGVHRPQAAVIVGLLAFLELIGSP